MRRPLRARAHPTAVRLSATHGSRPTSNPALQLDAPDQAGCERVYKDVGSGSLKHRPNSMRASTTYEPATRSSSGGSIASAAASST